MKTVFVTGGTGLSGANVCQQLKRRGDVVRALVRNPAEAAALADIGVELVQGDIADRHETGGDRHQPQCPPGPGKWWCTQRREATRSLDHRRGSVNAPEQRRDAQRIGQALFLPTIGLAVLDVEESEGGDEFAVKPLFPGAGILLHRLLSPR